MVSHSATYRLCYFAFTNRLIPTGHATCSGIYLFLVADSLHTYLVDCYEGYQRRDGILEPSLLPHDASGWSSDTRIVTVAVCIRPPHDTT